LGSDIRDPEKNYPGYRGHKDTEFRIRIRNADIFIYIFAQKDRNLDGITAQNLKVGSVMILKVLNQPPL
jgi:hypothetical protein